MSIEIKHINKSFGSYKALNDINLKVEEGELIALLGPSGCGKTTLLRTIAGLETPDSGSIILEGRDTSSLGPRERNVGFVFQHYALFRHMSVFENVAFGLKVLKGKDRPKKEAIQARVQELLSLVQMDWAEKRFPSQLSGGQRQRVALARALAVNPKVLLLDEPFSALDAKVRSELRRWLRKLHDEIHVTSIFVTHDQEEALELADRIVIVNKGVIEQIGTPEEVYDHPASPFVHNFLGNVNVFHLRMKDGQPVIGPAGHQDNLQGFVRPHEVVLTREREDENQIVAEILETRLIGSSVGLELAGAGVDGIIDAEIPRAQWKALNLSRGDKVFLTLKNIRVYTGGSYVI